MYLICLYAVTCMMYCVLKALFTRGIRQDTLRKEKSLIDGWVPFSFIEGASINILIERFNDSISSAK